MWSEKLDVVERVDTTRSETGSRSNYKLHNVMEIVCSIFGVGLPFKSRCFPDRCTQNAEL